MGVPDRKEILEALYREIHAFAGERDRGHRQLVPRVAVGRSLDSQIVLLAQGLARGSQRITGYPYRRPEGLSPGGRRLDAALAPLCHTIDHTNSSRLYGYHTDLVPWYPGKQAGGRYDNVPSEDEISECWHFFEREVKLVAPRAIVLLGLPAARACLNRYSDQHVRRAARLPELAANLYDADVEGHAVRMVVAWHPSSAWGKFAEPAAASYTAMQQLVAPLLAL